MDAVVAAAVPSIQRAAAHQVRTSMSVVSEGADLSRAGKALAGSALTGRTLAEPSMADVGDYLALMKPRVMSLVIFTALVGLVLAPGHVHPVIGFTAILCIAVGAGASGA